MLAFFKFQRHFSCYLIGKTIKVRTDNSALQWLRSFKEPVGQVACWMKRLVENDFEIVHRHRQRHANVDDLSRYPHPVSFITFSEQWLSPNLKNEFWKQGKDSITSTLIQWLKKTSIFDADQIEGFSRELKYYWTWLYAFAIEDGILGIRNLVTIGHDTQFCPIVFHTAN